MLGLWVYCGLSRLCLFLKILIENVVLKHKIKMYVFGKFKLFNQMSTF